MHRRALLFTGLLLLLLILTIGCSKEKEETPTSAQVSEYNLFEERGFSFLYPSNWNRLSTEDVDTIWETDIKNQVGIPRQKLTWFGGVYTGSVDPSKQRNSAAIFALIAKVPGYPGPMAEQELDQLFSNMKAAFKKGLGSRLISIKKQNVGEFQAIEIEGIGQSRRQVIRSIVIFVKPNYIYYFISGAYKDSYKTFQPIFDKSISNLNIEAENSQ